MTKCRSIQLFRTALFCALVAVGLLMTGCDSSGSNGGPEWVGDWKIVNEPFALSITKDKVETFGASTNGGDTTCEKTTFDVTNIDGNEVTTTDESGEEETVTLNVQENGQLEAEFEDGDTVTYDPLDQNPEDALGCDVVNDA